MIDTEKIVEQTPSIKELSPQKRQMLFAMMQAFNMTYEEQLKSGNTQLLKMCDGCAFKKGTQANNYAPTVLEVIECVMKQEPFYCHKKFCSDGEQPQLCAGWVNTMNTK